MENRDHVKLVNLEQKHQIEIYKWIESEKIGRDLADEAIVEWVKKYSIPFREWAESIPFNCLRCGLCSDCDCRDECCQPFNEERIHRLKL